MSERYTLLVRAARWEYDDDRGEVGPKQGAAMRTACVEENAVTLRRVSATMWAVVVAIVAAGADPVVASAAATPPGPRLDVTVDSGRLSVRADGVRLVDVLEAVGREAHVTIMLRGALDALVNENFAGVSVEEGLRRLTRWQSVVMIYDSSPSTVESPSSDAADASVLREVWVTSALPPARSTEQVAGQDSRREPQSQVGRPVAGSASASRPSVGASTNMTAALNQVNPEARKQMLQTLVREQGDYVVVGALREAAIVSASPVLRYRAVQTLESMHSADAIDALRAIVDTYRETATTNPDPRIRRGAIQGLAEITGPEAFDALRAALNDPNAGVATEARRALGRQSRGSGRDSIR